MGNTDFDEVNDTEDLFLLPLHGLYADLDAARGCVRLSDEFIASSAYARLQILGDWQREIAEQRGRAAVELFREITPPSAGMALSERIDRFRSLCRSMGLECPPNMLELLQRHPTAEGG